MKSVSLLLFTPEQDELGRLAVPDVVVAGPEENGAAQRPQLDEEMEDLQARIVSAIAAEGLEPALDPLDLRIVVGRAILSDDDGEEILIRVPVREAALEGGTPDEEDGPEVDRGPLLDGLFDLDLNQEINEEVLDE